MTGFCVHCMKDVEVRVEQKRTKCNLWSVDIEYDEKIAYCPICGNEVCVDRIEDENLKNCWSEFNKNKGNGGK